MARPEHVVRLAKFKLIRDSAELEAEVHSKGPGWFWEIYGRLKDNAADALAAMMVVNADNPSDIRELQMEIRLFDRFVEHTRTLVSEGKTADQETDQAEREDLLDHLSDRGEEGWAEAIDLGLVDGGPQDT
jgi:hypothetical protein